MCRWSSRGERLVAAEGQKKRGYVGGPESSCKADSFTRDEDTGGPIHPFRPDNYFMRITSLLPSFFTPLASHSAVPWPSAHPAKPTSDRGLRGPSCLALGNYLPTHSCVSSSSLLFSAFSLSFHVTCDSSAAVVQADALTVRVVGRGVGRLDLGVPCAFIIQLEEVSSSYYNCDI